MTHLCFQNYLSCFPIFSNFVLMIHGQWCPSWGQGWHVKVAMSQCLQSCQFSRWQNGTGLLQKRGECLSSQQCCHVGCNEVMLTPRVTQNSPFSSFSSLLPFLVRVKPNTSVWMVNSYSSKHHVFLSFLALTQNLSAIPYSQQNFFLSFSQGEKKQKSN